MARGRGFTRAGAAAWALVGAAAVAAAEPPAPGEGRGAPRLERRPAALVEFLGLSDQQKQAWRSLQEQRREEMKPFHEEGRTLRERLREALGATSPDPSEVGEATLALQAHRRKAKEQNEAFRARLEGLLSPEQKEKLRAFEAARRTMGEGRRGQRPARREAGARPLPD